MCMESCIGWWFLCSLTEDQRNLQSPIYQAVTNTVQHTLLPPKTPFICKPLSLQRIKRNRKMNHRGLKNEFHLTEFWQVAYPLALHANSLRSNSAPSQLRTYQSSYGILLFQTPTIHFPVSFYTLKSDRFTNEGCFGRRMCMVYCIGCKLKDW